LFPLDFLLPFKREDRVADIRLAQFIPLPDTTVEVSQSELARPAFHALPADV
jgi:hypothetical protein